MQPWDEFWGMWAQVMLALGGFAVVALLFVGVLAWFSHRSQERSYRAFRSRR